MMPHWFRSNRAAISARTLDDYNPIAVLVVGQFEFLLSTPNRFFKGSTTKYLKLRRYSALLRPKPHGARAMSSEVEAELHGLLERMSPQISDLMLRMMSINGLTWEQARAFRNEIVELNKTAKTDEEQSSLLFAFNSLMDHVEELNLIDPGSLDKLKGVRKADYLMMLNVQAMIGDVIDPSMLEYVTRREVEAGRLAADDGLRKLAVASAEVLGKSANTPRSQNWLGRLFGRG
jgi:hypothetical protein